MVKKKLGRPVEFDDLYHQVQREKMREHYAKQKREKEASENA